MTTNGKKTRASKAPKMPPALKLTPSDEDVLDTPSDVPAPMSPSTKKAGDAAATSSKKASRAKKAKSEREGVPVLEIIERLGTQQISGKSLNDDDRRDVVEYLISEGRSNADMSRILGVHVRTIERDRHKIRHKYKLREGSDLRRLMGGRLNSQMEWCLQQLHRMMRDKGLDARAKAEIPTRALAIVKDTIQTLHAVGCFGSDAAQEALVLPSPEVMDSECDRLEQIRLAGGTDDAADEREKKQIARAKGGCKLAKAMKEKDIGREDRNNAA